MDFDIPLDIAEFLTELDLFIERELKPLEAEDDNVRFFDHRREDSRTDWERGGLPNPVWEALLHRVRRMADAAGLYRYPLPKAHGGRDGTNLGMAMIREHLAAKGLGLHCDLQNEHSIVSNHIGLLLMLEYGTDEQKERFLRPLLENEIVSCFSMTEPQGGADPKVFRTKAELRGDQWVLNGEKWFSSNAHVSSFLIVMAVTDPDAKEYERMSMFVVPTDAPGVKILKNLAVGMHEGEGSHAYVRYEDVVVPRDAMLGPRGGAFVVAQTRLGGGRIHHAMRTIGQVRKAFDMMCERALSRHTQGTLLADKQMVQEKIADSWCEIEQFRLLVLRTAWRIDKLKDYRKVRKDIAAVKALMPKVFHDVAARALHLHGSLGATMEMPFVEQVIQSFHMGLADGPTEVHKITLARQVLRDYRATEDLFPSQHLPKLREAAIRKYGERIEREVAAQA